MDTATLVHRAIKLAYDLNSKEHLAGAPCRAAFETARAIIDAEYPNPNVNETTETILKSLGDRVVTQLVESGEYSPEDIEAAIDDCLQYW